jgi:hypothetical protein
MKGKHHFEHFRVNSNNDLERSSVESDIDEESKSG